MGNSLHVKLGLLGLSVLCSCAKQEQDLPQEQQDVAWRAVMQEQLQDYSEEGLPEVSEEQIDDYLEAMELAESSGQMAVRFRSRLEQASSLELSAVLLAIVEDREQDPLDKRRAYAWLRARGDDAMVPRLTLRLKYEKDWVANVDIGLALLLRGSGAGLDALHNILSTEQSADPESLEYARFKTMEALAYLPANQDWQAGNGFDADWQRLLEVQAHWKKHRQLPNPEQQKPGRAIRAETWRMLERFRSQPLRPVDDARFVLTRMPSWVFGALIKTTLENDRYVREHALQSLSWIGYPVGRWAEQESFNLADAYQTGIGGADSRPRLFEAMGASGLSSMQATLLPWLEQGNLEESTAAADAILRCGDDQILAQVSTLLASEVLLSPEARYSLTLLFTKEDAVAAIELPEGLDPSEARRRQEWRALRDTRP